MRARRPIAAQFDASLEDAPIRPVASTTSGAAHFDNHPTEIPEKRNRLQGVPTTSVAQVAAVQDGVAIAGGDTGDEL